MVYPMAKRLTKQDFYEQIQPLYVEGATHDYLTETLKYPAESLVEDIELYYEKLFSQSTEETEEAKITAANEAITEKLDAFLQTAQEFAAEPPSNTFNYEQFLTPKFHSKKALNTLTSKINAARLRFAKNVKENEELGIDPEIEVYSYLMQEAAHITAFRIASRQNSSLFEFAEHRLSQIMADYCYNMPLSKQADKEAHAMLHQQLVRMGLKQPTSTKTENILDAEGNLLPQFGGDGNDSHPEDTPEEIRDTFDSLGKSAKSLEELIEQRKREQEQRKKYLEESRGIDPATLAIGAGAYFAGRAVSSHAVATHERQKAMSHTEKLDAQKARAKEKRQQFVRNVKITAGVIISTLGSFVALDAALNNGYHVRRAMGMRANTPKEHAL